MSSVTGRTWEFYIYPESAKKNWRQILEENKIPCVISPYHNLDVWTADDPHFDPVKYVEGELKKGHYHVVLCFGGKRTYDSVLEINKMLQLDSSHPTLVDKVNDRGAAIRYLDHSTHKHKHQYNHSDIESFNGVDFEKFFQPTEEQEDELINGILDLIDEFNLIGYKGLLDFLRQVDPFNDSSELYENYFRHVRKHTIFWNAVLKDKRCSTIKEFDEI